MQKHFLDLQHEEKGRGFFIEFKVFKLDLKHDVIHKIMHLKRLKPSE
jgi:hypothetical protein